MTGAGLERVATMLEARRAELAAQTLERIRAAIPAYAAISDPAILADVTQHVAENHDVLRLSLLRGRPVSEEDLAFIRPHAALRARRGVPVADFLHAFRIGHWVIWDAIVELAEEDEEVRAAALLAASLVIEFIDHASTHAAQSYVEAQQLLLAEGDRVRRDLLEDLLAGREPAPGPRLSAARGAGLDSGGRCALLVAVPVCALEDEIEFRSAASALARAVGGAVRPLTVVRQDEIVIVRALGTQEVQTISEPVERATRELAAGGMRLAVGISPMFETTAGLPEAYRDACVAVESLGSEGGVLALADLSAFDYLTLRADPTAKRLLSPAIQRFVDEDAAAGGALTTTLLEYAAANLNAKVAAQRLFIHVNTAHHRLARIEEKTGCDLRDLADVQELLIAIKIASGRAATPGSTAAQVFRSHRAGEKTGAGRAHGRSPSKAF
jgi:sugar diacid utilization regulator